MSVPVQESLLDLGGTPAPGPLRPERTRLAHGAWIDVQRGWLTGAGELFARLAERVPWRAERRRMYDRTVDVPRLLRFYQEGADLPDPVLATCRDMLSGHYRAELGESFVTAGLCLYRDGRDSVAWHGDTIGRGSTEDTMVAILSLGEARPLMLRPRPGGGGAGSGDGKAGPLRYNLGHGDLIVMGGSCQRTWEHAVPKSARPAGPRISVQFRPRGVRLGLVGNLMAVVRLIRDSRDGVCRAAACGAASGRRAVPAVRRAAAIREPDARVEFLCSYSTHFFRKDARDGRICFEGRQTDVAGTSP